MHSSPEDYTHSSFEAALARAKVGERLSPADALELLTTGSDSDGIDTSRKQKVLMVADQRRQETVGDQVTFVANMNNNLTNICDVGCLFCNYHKTTSSIANGSKGGYIKSPRQSTEAVQKAIKMGISEVCSVSGLHPGLALDQSHQDILADSSAKFSDETLGFSSTYVDHIRAMNIDDIHIHAINPAEAHHAQRHADWGYRHVYERLSECGLNSVPGTAAEILVDDIRDQICPNKISSESWIAAMEAAADVGLDLTTTIMYGHVESTKDRIQHLDRIRRLQDRTGAVTEFIPLKFMHKETPLHHDGTVSESTTRHEDELLTAVSRLFLDNIDHIQASWVKYGDSRALQLLNCGADDFMGTVLSEEITASAGGEHGNFRSFTEYVDMISAIDRIPVERSADYCRLHSIDIENQPYGPTIGPRADGSPMLPSKS